MVLFGQPTFGVFFVYLSWIGLQDPFLTSVLQYSDFIPLKVITAIFLVYCIISEVLNTYLWSLVVFQMASLQLEWQ